MAYLTACRASEISVQVSPAYFPLSFPSLCEVGTVGPMGMACPPSRTVRARFRAYGSPSLCEHPIPTWFTVSIRMTSLSVWDTRTVSLPLSVRLSTVLPRLIPWLIQNVLAAPPITGKHWVLWRLRRHTGEVTKHIHQLRRSRIAA
jgi:hypothetical protein